MYTAIDWKCSVLFRDNNYFLRIIISRMSVLYLNDFLIYLSVDTNLRYDQVRKYLHVSTDETMDLLSASRTNEFSINGECRKLNSAAYSLRRTVSRTGLPRGNRCHTVCLRSNPGVTALTVTE